MKVIIIAAVDLNLGIGEDNGLLFRIPEDMKHFIEATKGNSVIMGRKTFESIGGKALIMRKNIVLSNNREYKSDVVYVEHDIDSAMASAKEYGNKIFVIGGSEIYKEFLDRNLVDEIYLTVYNKKFENANKFFPDDGNSYGFVKKEEFLRGEHDGAEFVIVRLIKENNFNE